jgi:hypothetical protein
VAKEEKSKGNEKISLKAQITLHKKGLQPKLSNAKIFGRYEFEPGGYCTK